MAEIKHALFLHLVKRQFQVNHSKWADIFSSIQRRLRLAFGYRQTLLLCKTNGDFGTIMRDGGGEMCIKEGLTIDGDSVQTFFSFSVISRTGPCAAVIQRFCREGKHDVSFQFLHIAEKYKAHEQTFKSLPEYPSVILATDPRSTSGANVSLDNMTFKIFSLFCASGRSTIILPVRINAKRLAVDTRLSTSGNHRSLPARKPSNNSFIKIMWPICGSKYKYALSLFSAQTIPIYHKFIFNLAHCFVLLLASPHC
jgi:hypothetical protein